MQGLVQAPERGLHADRLAGWRVQLPHSVGLDFVHVPAAHAYPLAVPPPVVGEELGYWLANAGAARPRHQRRETVRPGLAVRGGALALVVEEVRPREEDALLQQRLEVLH